MFRRIASASLLLLMLVWATVQSETVYVDEAPARPPTAQELAKMAQEIRTLSNEARQQSSVQPLDAGSHLDKAAKEHSQEMLDLDYFGHHSPTPGLESPTDRIRAAGGVELTNAENVYKCSGYDPEQVAALAVKAFLKSPTHRKNLLNSKYNHIGIGVAYKNSAYTVTQLFTFTTIQVDSLQVKPAGGGYQVDIEARVLSGPKNGAFFLGNTKIEAWEADAEGRIKASFETGQGMVAIGQKSGTQHSIECEFPVPKPR